MKLLVALGNPGPRYQWTRHNAGFWLIDEIAKDANVQWETGGGDRFQGEVGRGSVCGQSCVLLKPMTYMNLSGRSVLAVAQFYKVPSVDWVVLHDDIDLSPGKVRGRSGGGHGGHNGIRSIMELSGKSDFNRIKLGVGRPEKTVDGGPGMDVSDFVLSPMRSSDAEEYVRSVKPEVLLRLQEMFRH